EVAGGEEEGVVDRGGVVAGVDGDVFAAVEDGFVDLDQADVVDVVEGEGDVAFPTRAGGGEQADVGVDRVVGQIAHALVEGIDRGEHALDPALDEDGLHPRRPG